MKNRIASEKKRFEQYLAIERQMLELRERELASLEKTRRQQSIRAAVKLWLEHGSTHEDALRFAMIQVGCTPHRSLSGPAVASPLLPAPPPVQRFVPSVTPVTGGSNSTAAPNQNQRPVSVAQRPLAVQRFVPAVTPVAASTPQKPAPPAVVQRFTNASSATVSTAVVQRPVNVAQRPLSVPRFVPAVTPVTNASPKAPGTAGLQRGPVPNIQRPVSAGQRPIPVARFVPAVSPGTSQAPNAVATASVQRFCPTSVTPVTGTVSTTVSTVAVQRHVVQSPLAGMGRTVPAMQRFVASVNGTSVAVKTVAMADKRRVKRKRTRMRRPHSKRTTTVRTNMTPSA